MASASAVVLLEVVAFDCCNSDWGLLGCGSEDGRPLRLHILDNEKVKFLEFCSLSGPHWAKVRAKYFGINNNAM